MSAIEQLMGEVIIVKEKERYSNWKFIQVIKNIKTKGRLFQMKQTPFF
jgi:hypothetical protein